LISSNVFRFFKNDSGTTAAGFLSRGTFLGFDDPFFC